MINLNELAVEVSKCEGKKEQQNIAQIKETMKCIFCRLSRYTDKEIIEAIRHIANLYPDLIK